MTSKRQFLQLMGGVFASGIAGCAQFNVDDAPEREATSTRTESRSKTVDTPNVQTPTKTDTPSDRTFRPWAVPDGTSVFSIVNTTERKDGRYTVHTYKFGGSESLSTCLQKYTYETALLDNEGNNIWRTPFRLHVGVSPGSRLEDVLAAFNKEYYPPKKPFYPQPEAPLIEGSETDKGLYFELPVSGDIQDVRLTSRTLKNFDSYTIDNNGNLRIPYGNLKPYYLSKPLLKATITTTTSEKDLYLRVPQPDVSMSIKKIETQDKDNKRQLKAIEAEVTIDSKKPTQHVNLHTNFGGTLSYDYDHSIPRDKFVSIDGSTTASVRRDFTKPLKSVDEDDFAESYPIKQKEFKVVLAQVAPLATKTLSRDRFL